MTDRVEPLNAKDDTIAAPRTNTATDSEAQRAYYEQTAQVYDELHATDHEHDLALYLLASIIELYKITSVLDLGAGTGRVARFLKHRHPNLNVLSIEPVRALRDVGYAHGLSSSELIDGDATHLHFADNEFDLVCEFATLHHIKRPELAVREMLRVSKTAIFISDSNNFGQGSQATRSLKQLANAMGLWRLVDWVKTGGKGYTISEGDGLGYSYSVYNNFREISRQCDIHVLNTVDAGVNPYRTAGHVALLGLKRRGGKR